MSDEWWSSLCAWKQNLICSEFISMESHDILEFWQNICWFWSGILVTNSVSEVAHWPGKRFSDYLCDWMKEFTEMAIWKISFRCIYAKVFNYRWNVCVCTIDEISNICLMPPQSVNFEENWFIMSRQRTAYTVLRIVPMKCGYPVRLLQRRLWWWQRVTN